jgi:hypothetical protein
MFFVLAIRRIRGQKELYLYPMLPDFLKSTHLVEGFQAANVSPDKSSTTTNVTMEHLSNDTDRDKLKHSEQNLSLPHFVHQMSRANWLGNKSGLPR